MVVIAALAEQVFAKQNSEQSTQILPARRRNFRLIPGKLDEQKNVRQLKQTPAPTPAKPELSTTELVLKHREAAWRLALSMVQRWGSKIEQDELRSITDIALCEAASRFRSDVGAGFMTFFFYHLKGSLVKTIAIRAKKRFVLVDDIENLSQGNPICQRGEGADSDEISFFPDQALMMQLKDETTLEDKIITRDLLNKCVLASSKLRGLDREIIQRVYFNGEDLNTLPKTLGFSRGHIFRVRSRALDKLKKHLKV